MPEFPDIEDIPENEVIAELYCHVIFWTRKLQPAVSREALAKMVAETDQAMFTVEGEALAAGGSENHLHILIRFSPEHSLQEALDALRKRSAALVARECDVPDFAWSESEVGVGVGPDDLDKAREFIETQAAHHEIVTFQCELKAIFDEHGFDYDERELFD